MNEGVGTDALRTALAELPADVILRATVDVLLAADPAGLPGRMALRRVESLLQDATRLQLAVVAGVGDVDRRELFALDSAGSTRVWLRRLPGGEDMQLTRARRLAQRPRVRAAVAQGAVSLRGADAVCTALDAVPADLDEATTVAFLHDGIGEILSQAVASGLSDGDAAVIAECVTSTGMGPAERIEPALVLLAQRVIPAVLGRALTQLTEAIRPVDTTDPANSHHYYLELRPLLDGDWDLRGVLDPETGQLLAQHMDRHERSTRTNADRTGVSEAGDSSGDPNDTAGDQPDAETEATDQVGADSAQVLNLELPEPSGNVRDRLAPGPVVDTDPVCKHQPDRSARECVLCGPNRFATANSRRHNALTHLLRDAAHRGLGDGQTAPTALCVTTSVGALTGQAGAPPAVIHHPGIPPVPIPTETVQRLACNSELAAVVLDADRTPIGASHTARSATGRERRALKARWGPHCAVHGCPNTATVPHHVRPFHLSRETVLRDLVPLCGSCHHDIHEGHRTLRLRNQSHINDTGWADAVEVGRAA